uniref:Uncharacterized protein n=1 Tax=Brassica oleracea TaxID=3712 RepID=A0A3P6E5X4_BRAOL|nr:unnamed protein product [Brassica oleracea]
MEETQAMALEEMKGIHVTREDPMIVMTVINWILRMMSSQRDLIGQDQMQEGRDMIF